ncbi:hypothetical protein ACYOEI_13660 [Singulisphaera rosea]
METQTLGYESLKTSRGWIFTLHRAESQGNRGHGWFLSISAIFMIGVGIIAHRRAMAPGPGIGLELSRSIPIALLFLILGVALAISATRWWGGPVRLILEAEAIRIARRIGPIAWSKAIPRAEVAQLTVIRRSWFIDPGQDGSESRDYHALVAEDVSGRKRTLAAHYPRESLLALALEISSHWKGLTIDPDFDSPGPGKLAVGEDTEIPTDIRERSSPPRGTRLTLEPVGRRGVRITIPPAGYSHPRFILSLLAGLFLLAWAAVLALPPILDHVVGKPPGEELMTWTGVGLRAGVGLLALLAAAQSTALQHTLLATPETLTLTSKGLMGRSRKTWQRPAVASLRVDTRVEDSSSNDSSTSTRILIRTIYSEAAGTSDVVFFVGNLDTDTLVRLLRKPKGAPPSAFLVVGSRMGPGPIADSTPIADGPYDYAAHSKPSSEGPQAIGPILSSRVGPEFEELVSDRDLLSKPEMEWIATTLRRVLKVSDSDGPERDPVPTGSAESPADR